jgi:putative sterol carrier protein
VRYPSDEWIKELQKVCNQDPEFKDACANFSGKLVFQIEAEPGRLDRTAYLFCWPDHGEFREAMALSSPEERPDVEYIIAGKYSNWKEIVRGRQEPLRALMSRRVKLVKGSQLKLLKQVKFALRMMHNSTQIDAEFPDEGP